MGDVLQPKSADIRIGLHFGHEIAQFPHEYRRPQRVFLDLHRIESGQRAHARIQHRQRMLHQRQQVLQQARRFERFADGVVVHKLQHGRIRQLGQAGKTAPILLHRDRLPQPARIVLDQHPARLGQAPGREGEKMAQSRVFTRQFGRLQRNVDRIQAPGEQRPGPCLHLLGALLKQSGAFRSHGSELHRMKRRHDINLRAYIDPASHLRCDCHAISRAD
jgi:hypothetical protein